MKTIIDIAVDHSTNNMTYYSAYDESLTYDQNIYVQGFIDGVIAAINSLGRDPAWNDAKEMIKYRIGLPYSN